MTDYLPIVISILGAVIAAASLYLSNYRRPQIRMALGPDVHLYHPSDGGSAIYLPVVVTNNSPTEGPVLQIYLQIKHPDGNVYTLKWLEEWSIRYRDDFKYEFISRAAPFSVGGRGSTTKVLWFLWPAGAREHFLFSDGSYEFKLLFWSKRTNIPSGSSTETLEIPLEAADELRSRFDARDPLTQYFYFTDKGFIAERSSDVGTIWDRRDLTP